MGHGSLDGWAGIGDGEEARHPRSIIAQDGVRQSSKVRHGMALKELWSSVTALKELWPSVTARKELWPSATALKELWLSRSDRLS